MQGDGLRSLIIFSFSGEVLKIVRQKDISEILLFFKSLRFYILYLSNSLINEGNAAACFYRVNIGKAVRH